MQVVRFSPTLAWLHSPAARAASLLSPVMASMVMLVVAVTRGRQSVHGRMLLCDPVQAVQAGQALCRSTCHWGKGHSGRVKLDCVPSGHLRFAVGLGRGRCRHTPLARARGVWCE